MGEGSGGGPHVGYPGARPGPLVGEGSRGSVQGMPWSDIDISVNGQIDDRELNALHAAAFGSDSTEIPWGDRLARRSLFWVTARERGELLGFVNVIGDGGAHAFLLDTCVRPWRQAEGIGSALVEAAVVEARERGCEWLHADYDQGRAPFYEKLGMRPTAAGLLRLR